MSAGKKIHFHFQVKPFSLTNRNRLKDFLTNLCVKEKRAVEHINYIFCDDASLLSINQQFLKHNTYTDIITFDFSELYQPLISDIYISVERVKENSNTYGISFKKELCRVMIHGALHLCGYSDKVAFQKEEMKKKEDFYLARLFSFT